MLRKIHAQMDDEYDEQRGKTRAVGHFILCAAIPLAVAAIAEEFGASFWWTKLGIFVTWLVGLRGVWLWEHHDLAKKKNGPAKRIYDLWSKWLGLTFGAAAWWTWFV